MKYRVKISRYIRAKAEIEIEADDLFQAAELLRADAENGMGELYNSATTLDWTYVDDPTIDEMIEIDTGRLMPPISLTYENGEVISEDSLSAFLEDMDQYTDIVFQNITRH